ncbi:solute carrier family 7 member 14-like [Macrobrachium rosenbergii]|uniref:solute carrier family 7 member 14-like n=1 Tax=Macrobrachium rosenbergii TaxID=79674 RepID=UPI0034D3A10D
MGAVVTRFCNAVTRKKSVNTPTPGLQKRLSLVDLAAVGVSSVVGVGGYVCVGAGAAEWAGPSIILSVLLTSFSTILTGFVCAELHVRIPKGCGVYAHVYTTMGELPAVLVASSLLLDLLLLPAFAARSSSQYMESSINRSLSDLTLHPRLTFIHDSRYISPDYDLAALALVTLCTLMVVAGTKVVCQIGGIAVGVSLLVLSAISCTAFVRADLKHWTQHQGFFPRGLHGVMNGGAIMSIGVIGSHTSSFLMDECQHSKDTLSRLGMAIGIVFLLALFPSAVAFTLASPSFETAAPLGNLFPGASLMAMRALVGVGGILGLWATVLSSLFGASRLLHRLSCDGLAPRWLRVISPHTATPWVSILICGILFRHNSCHLFFLAPSEDPGYWEFGRRRGWGNGGAIAPISPPARSLGRDYPHQPRPFRDF